MMVRSLANAPQIGRIHWCNTQRPPLRRFPLATTAGPYILAPLVGVSPARPGRRDGAGRRPAQGAQWGSLSAMGSTSFGMGWRFDLSQSREPGSIDYGDFRAGSNRCLLILCNRSDRILNGLSVEHPSGHKRSPLAGKEHV
jgi:hypothetical protein